MKNWLEIKKVLPHILFAISLLIVDILLLFIAFYFTFYMFKNDLNNFYLDYRAFINLFPRLVDTYILALIIAWGINKRKIFSPLNIVISTSAILVFLLFFSLAMARLTEKFSFSLFVVFLSFTISFFTLNISHLCANIIYNKHLKSDHTVI